LPFIQRLSAHFIFRSVAKSGSYHSNKQIFLKK
jgi:hypothetical protein